MFEEKTEIAAGYAEKNFANAAEAAQRKIPSKEETDIGKALVAEDAGAAQAMEVGEKAAAASASGMPLPAAASEEEKKVIPLRFTIFSYLIGYFWICSFLFPEYSLLHGFAEGRLTVGGVTVFYDWRPLFFVVLFACWAAGAIRWVLKKQPVGQANLPNRESWLWLCCMLCMALATAFGRCRAVDGWQVFALHGMAAYWVLCYAGKLSDGETGPLVVWDAFNALVLLPIGGIFLRLAHIIKAIVHGLSAQKENKHPKRDWKSLALGAAVVAAAVPFLILAGSLLGQADAAFELLTSRIGSIFTIHWEIPYEITRACTEVIGRFVFGIPVGAYLYGLVLLGSTRKTEKTQAFYREAEKLRIAPQTAIVVVLLAFEVLYTLFFLVQAGSMLAAFRGIVPGTLTAAQYARAGFFQLCQVMAINFALLAAAAKCCRIPLRQNKALKWLTAILMGMSLLLAVTASGKLLLYIRRFGFTPLRLLSAWGILVLSAGCVLALVSLFRPCKVVKKWVFFAAVSFALLCWF